MVKVTEGKVNGITMTPSPPPPNKHRRNRDNIISNAASNYISVFSVIVFISGCVRPLTATPAPFVSSTSSETMMPLLPLQQADDQPFSADVIDNFLTNRCGTCNPDESPALWSYEGTLTDPTTGKVIADVEGLELIKRLPVVDRTQFIDNNERSMLDKLHAKSLLCSENKSTPQWDVAMTVLCRRLFCYRHRKSRIGPNLGSSTESSPCNSLLTSIRLRPDGPLRHLSPSESMSIYDSALTYISRNKGRELVIISERGGCGSTNPEDAELKKQFVMGNAEINSSNKKSPSSLFEYSILARRGSERNGPAPLPPLKASGGVESAEVTISPPRSRFLQFGKGDGSDNSSARKYGSARETYSYTLDNDFELGDDSSSTNDNIFIRIVDQFGLRRQRATPTKSTNQCRVVYNRYGEAPPWYAPGRSCTLELRGERINMPEFVELAHGKSSASSPNLPSIASWAASKCNFWSGWPALFSDRIKTADCVDLVKQYYQMPPESDVALARRAVELFCSERNLSFDRMDNEYPIPERNRWLASTENVLSKVQGCMKRLSKSLIV